MELDLDAARAARAETRTEPHHILFGGQKFKLPVELPWDYFEILDTGDMKEALRFLLDDQFDEFWTHVPSPDDMKELATGIPRLYGFGSGESSASGGSSGPIGSHSRQTSPAATGSTSAKRSGARRRSG